MVQGDSKIHIQGDNHPNSFTLILGWSVEDFCCFLNLSLNGTQISGLSLFAIFPHRNMLNAIVCLALCDTPDEGNKKQNLMPFKISTLGNLKNTDYLIQTDLPYKNHVSLV